MSAHESLMSEVEGGWGELLHEAGSAVSPTQKKCWVVIVKDE